MELISVPVRRADELNAALASMMQERPDALLMTNDPLLQRHVGTTIDFVAEHRLPASYQAREHVVAGGLMSYGASSPELFRRGAIYVHRILQGTKPQDLPVEQPSKFEACVQPKDCQSTWPRRPGSAPRPRRRGDRMRRPGVRGASRRRGCRVPGPVGPRARRRAGPADRRSGDQARILGTRNIWKAAMKRKRRSAARQAWVT